MLRAMSSPFLIVATLLLAFACGGESNDKPEATAGLTRTRTPQPIAAPVLYATIGPEAACNAREVRPDLDSFHCWAVEVAGVLVVASAAVDSATVNTAAQTVAEMLRFREDIRDRLAKLHPKIIIVGPQELITDAPELRHMRNSTLYDERGYGELRGWSGGVIAAVGAEGIIGLDAGTAERDDVMVHEFAHVLHTLGLTPREWTLSHTLYTRSLAKGRWQDTYAGRNYLEFFAELTQIYFGVKGAAYTATNPEELRTYDPEAADFLEQVYGPR